MDTLPFGSLFRLDSLSSSSKISRLFHVFRLAGDHDFHLTCYPRSKVEFRIGEAIDATERVGICS